MIYVAVQDVNAILRLSIKECLKFNVLCLSLATLGLPAENCAACFT